MRKYVSVVFTLLIISGMALYAQESTEPVQHKIGLGLKFGTGIIVGDDLSKQNQSAGPVSSLEMHVDLQETVEIVTEFAYGYNDVKFSLGSANVTRIYQRSYTIGFRFYLNKMRFGRIVPTLSFGSGYYEWFYTNSDEPLNLGKDGVQTYKGEELSFHSVGLNAGTGFRFRITDNFALDGIFRFHFIQSKDNRDRFGPDDDNDMNIDLGVGVVYLFPVGS